MLAAMEAAKFAASIGAQLAAKMKSIGGADTSGASYAKVEAALKELRTATRDAVSRDEQEANSLWVELGALVRHGFDYFRAKREFDAGAAAAKAALEGAVRAAETVVRVNVAPHADAPARLREAAERWQKKQRLIMKTAATIPPLQVVEGWSGPSASQYGSAAELQGTASQSFASYLGAVQQGYDAGRRLNEAVLFTLTQDLENAAKTVASNNASLSSNGSEYYRRTCSAARTVSMSLQAVTADVSGRVAGDAASALSSQLNQARSSSAVLSPGSWPTGTRGAGGHKPENMNTVTHPQDVDTSSATTGPTSTQGVNY